jgi:hypothetical protein
MTTAAEDILEPPPPPPKPRPDLLAAAKLILHECDTLDGVISDYALNKLRAAVAAVSS